MTAAFLILTAALAGGASRPQAQAPAAPAVTVEGCVAAQDDIPGGQAHTAERPGVAEDFILTNAKVVKGSAPTPASGDTSGGVISNALRPMFAIGGLSSDQIKSHAGHRVRIEGTFDDIRRDPAAATDGDVVQLTGTTILQIQGACPALPRKSD